MNFFKSQDIARRNTTKLVFLFSLAVLSIIVLINLLITGIIIYSSEKNSQSYFSKQGIIDAFDPETVLMVSVGVIIIIVLGSFYKIIALASGGSRVAEMLGADLIVDGTGDPHKQRVLNVVEEMAIASGIPVPPVYLMNENGINAFAAGYSPSDAVIGITSGAINKLTRDQLQGIIAHEFSHIFNGDMKLNIRLMGILHGILIIGLLGEMIMRSSGGSRNSKEGGGAVFIGLGLFIIGYTGILFGNMIKAAVSRQREYLADASAVQFTRNPEGIAGALKRIGGNEMGSYIENPNGSEISHALFGEGKSSFFINLFATHPPLKKRIRAVEPGWNGEYDYAVPEAIEKEKPSDKKSTITGLNLGVAGVIIGKAIEQQIGQLDADHIKQAQTLIQSIPFVFQNAVHSPFSARAVIYFLVLDKNDAIKNNQLSILEEYADPLVYDETLKLCKTDQSIETEHRLTLIDMALPTLRQLSKQQFNLFKNNLNKLIEIDNKISLFEWTVRKIVLHHLEQSFEPENKNTSGSKTLKRCRESCSLLISLLAFAGGDGNEEAFKKAKTVLDVDIRFISKKDIKINNLNKALDDLNKVKPLHKEKLLKACVACITADNIVNAHEKELFRAIADTLGCPIPPMIDQA